MRYHHLFHRFLFYSVILGCLSYFISCSKSGNTNNSSGIDSTGGLSAGDTTAGSFTAVRPAHIVIAMLENHAEAGIAGNVQAPYINSLIKDAHTAYFTHSFAIAHPSQPNYLAIFSGSTQGITNDNTPANTPWSTANLGAELLSNSYTFAGYSEDLPSVGFNGSSNGKYVRKHNPWANWQGSGDNRLPASVNQPFSAFPSDYSLLPTVSFVVPDLNNDMHDGSILRGDTWLKDHLDPYIQWAKSHNSLFILTFDEDDKSSSNQILTLITGENIKVGTYDTKIDHYSILRTIEQLYGITYAGFSANVPAIKGIWLQ